MLSRRGSSDVLVRSLARYLAAVEGAAGSLWRTAVTFDFRQRSPTETWERGAPRERTPVTAVLNYDPANVDKARSTAAPPSLAFIARGGVIAVAAIAPFGQMHREPYLPDLR